MIDHWLWRTEKIPPAVTAFLAGLLGSPLLVELVKMALAATVLGAFVSLTALACRGTSLRCLAGEAPAP